MKLLVIDPSNNSNADLGQNKKKNQKKRRKEKNKEKNLNKRVPENERKKTASANSAQPIKYSYPYHHCHILGQGIWGE